MECPACKRPLDRITVAGVNVDVCDGCAGIWFDNQELEKFDEPDEGAGEQLLELPADGGAPVDRTARYRCPTGDGAVLMRHFFSAKRSVQVDECPACGGYWLDAGELRSIRAEYPDEESRTRAAVALMQELFGEEILAQQRESDAELARARRVANMFRFICPSYYLPGDQEWGAF